MCLHFPALHYKKGEGEFELIQGFSPAVPLSALVSLPGYFPQCWVFGSAVKRTSVSSVNVPPTLFCLSKLLERAQQAAPEVLPHPPAGRPGAGGRDTVTLGDSLGLKLTSHLGSDLQTVVQLR